jgi:hypothetical protein
MEALPVMVNVVLAEELLEKVPPLPVQPLKAKLAVGVAVSEICV